MILKYYIDAPYSNNIIIHTSSNLKILRKIENSLFPPLAPLAAPINLTHFASSIAVTSWYLVFEMKPPDFFLTLSVPPQTEKPL